MKSAELIELNLEELNAKKEELIRQLSQLRFQHATAQLENPIIIRSVRRDIARVKTILNDRKKDS